MKHLFLLGGGVMQIPAITAARALGWRVTMADGNADCSGRALVDSFVHVDLRDKEGLARAAAACQPAINGVFTAGTDFSTSVAFVAEQLGLPGIPYEAAMNASDKDRMRHVLRQNGVPVPKHAAVGVHDRGEPLLATAASIGYPLVVKPVDNMGARGVRRVDAPAQLTAAVATARNASATRRALMESFIEGPEYSLDALVVDGAVHVTGIADRHIFFPPYFVEMGHTLPADIHTTAREALESVFIRAIAALGITRGAAKGDIFLTRDGAVVGEVAARLSGGFMSGWTFPNATGIDVTKLALRVAMGESIDVAEFTERGDRVSAERAIVSAPGVVANVANDAPQCNGVTNVFVKVQRGDTVDLPTNNVEKVANIITCAPNRETAMRAATDAMLEISVDLETGDERTDDFVFCTGFDSPFRPYQLQDVGTFPLLRDDTDEFLRDLSRAILAGEPMPVTDRSAAVETRYPVPSGPDLFQRLCRVNAIVGTDRGVDGLFWRAFVSSGRQGVTYLAATIVSQARRGRLAAWVGQLRSGSV